MIRVPWAVPHIDDEELAEVLDAVKTNWLSMGKRVRQFEVSMSDYLGVRHAVAVSNGTVALDLALKVLNVGPGDEVLLPAMSYIATLFAVLYQRATPVFVDIEPDTFNIDPDDVERKLTSRTRCILFIDYGGNPAQHQRLREVAERRNIPLLLDGAQSLGGVYRGVPLGGQGRISTMSFHAAKLLTTIEGGMVFTDDEAVAARLRVLRNQGEDPHKKYIHVELGYNARMTDLAAAVGLAQFRKFRAIQKRRAEIAAFYSRRFSGHPGLRLPVRRNCGREGCGDGETCCRNGWFLYPILVENRDSVADRLRDLGVDTRICYPMPMYRQPFFATYGSGDPETNRCPVSEDVTRRVLNLPMYHTLSESDLNYVCDSLIRTLEG